MTPDEFRDHLRTKNAADIVDEYIINDVPGPHLKPDALVFLAERARLAFQIKPEQDLTPIVVGSAKLGFSFTEKREKESGYKPRYRSYDPGGSDIDIAIVSPILYGKIWRGIALYGANQRHFPWRSDLGTYMLHGWIRPDKFPDPLPQECKDWRELMNNLSQSTFFKYRRLRCAIYHSKYFLKIYQQRGVSEAQNAETLL